VEVAEKISWLLHLLLEVESHDRVWHGNVGYVVQAAFRYLDGAGFDLASIARLEYLYFDVLAHSERRPLALFGVLVTQASEFVGLARTVWFRGKGSESSQKVWSHAYDVLSCLEESGGIFLDHYHSSDALANFINSVRQEAANPKEVACYEEIIGQALARAKDSSTGIVPASFVFEAIEACHSASLLHGLSIGLSNSRGIVSRGLDAGGDAERDLAAKYAEACRSLLPSCPNVASVLQDLAKRYLLDALREDGRADLRMDRD